MVYGILPFSFLFHPLGHKDQRIPILSWDVGNALGLSGKHTARRRRRPGTASTQCNILRLSMRDDAVLVRESL